MLVSEAHRIGRLGWGKLPSYRGWAVVRTFAGPGPMPSVASPARPKRRPQALSERRRSGEARPVRNLPGSGSVGPFSCRPPFGYRRRSTVSLPLPSIMKTMLPMSVTETALLKSAPGPFAAVLPTTMLDSTVYTLPTHRRIISRLCHNYTLHCNTKAAASRVSERCGRSYSLGSRTRSFTGRCLHRKWTRS